MSCSNTAPKAAAVVDDDQTWAMEVPEEYLDINDNDKYSCSNDKESCANKNSANIISTDKTCNDTPLFLKNELGILDMLLNEIWVVNGTIPDDIDHEEPVHKAENEVLTVQNIPEVNLYNSGASRHITPFCHQFLKYQSIEPCPIYAADKQNLFAIGAGKMKIGVPKYGEITLITLTDMLHTPDITLTVISIHCITRAGYLVSFEGEHCKIKDKKGEIIGDILANKNGLYKVKHAYTALTDLESVDLHMLHC